MDIISQNDYRSLSDLHTKSNNKIPMGLIDKETVLLCTINHLESERDSLLNTVADLRQLIKRITVQEDQEAQRKQRIQNEYLIKIRSLENALKVSENHSRDFKNLAEYWNEFLI